MQKIAIIGSCGAGKSTLAGQLGPLLNLKVIHLDQVYWQPGWVEADPLAWRRRVATLISEQAWIIDGNYSGTFDLRLPATDTIVFLDFPRWLCLWRVCQRIWHYRGQTRPDMAPHCSERLNWEFLWYVWCFPSQNRPKIAQALAACHPDQTVITCRNPGAVRQFLAQLQPLVHPCS